MEGEEGTDGVEVEEKSFASTIYEKCSKGGRKSDKVSALTRFLGISSRPRAVADVADAGADARAEEETETGAESEGKGKHKYEEEEEEVKEEEEDDDEKEAEVAGRRDDAELGICSHVMRNKLENTERKRESEKAGTAEEEDTAGAGADDKKH